MLTLYYGPGACSMASHIVLEESGEKYKPKRMDLAKGEQRTEAYLKMNPLGRVPLLQLDNGEPLAENTAILPYLGKRFELWPTDATAEAKALSLIGFFAASVHPAHAHVGRPERYTADQSALPGIKEQGLKTFHGHLKQIDGMYAGREWLGDSYSVLDPYGFVFYTWGVRRELPMGELKNYTAFKDRMTKRPAVAARARGREDQGVSALRCSPRPHPESVRERCVSKRGARCWRPSFETRASRGLPDEAGEASLTRSPHGRHRLSSSRLVAGQVSAPVSAVVGHEPQPRLHAGRSQARAESLRHRRHHPGAVARQVGGDAALPRCRGAERFHPRGGRLGAARRSAGLRATRSTS